MKHKASTAMAIRPRNILAQYAAMTFLVLTGVLTRQWCLAMLAVPVFFYLIIGLDISDETKRSGQHLPA
ncbi:MAG: hypothetical protein AAFO94_08670, partial [Bacteroidota bacterium]